MIQHMTTTTRMVLLSFLDDPDAELYGLHITARTGLRPGTVYPILTRLYVAGLLASRREGGDEYTNGRPPRLYYRLTPSGWDLARSEQVAADHRARTAKLATRKETTT
jgi:DNA-binding PadR family transcriptional regulator